MEVKRVHEVRWRRTLTFNLWRTIGPDVVVEKISEGVAKRRTLASFSQSPCELPITGAIWLPHPRRVLP